MEQLLPLLRRINQRKPLIIAATGRLGEALREYQRFQETVQRELGIPPLPETQALARQVRASAAA